MKKEIKNYTQRCEEHPDHQEGMITHQICLDRAFEEIDELRSYIKELEEQVSTSRPCSEKGCNKHENFVDGCGYCNKNKKFISEIKGE